MSMSEFDLNISTGNKQDLSIYVHIPFCNSKCKYCSFVSMVANEDDKKRYFNALVSEIKMQSKEYRSNYKVVSIYIGGGTPSSLDHYYIRDLLSVIYKNFAVKNTAEITIEINPNSVDKNKIREYILSGVNRFSIGLQSISGKVLKNMGRTHTAEDFEKAVNIIREYGIKNISADIIIGYPGQKMSDVKEVLNFLIKLEIPHISAYMLQVEQGTELKRLVDNGSIGLPEEDLVVDMYQYIVSTLSSFGYGRYELSNFAKPAYESVHNKTYWKRNDYLGVGLASHSYIKGVRFANTENIIEYVSKVENEQEIPVSARKTLTLEEKKEEAIMLSLRTSEGIDLQAYQIEFGENLLEKKKKIIAKLIEGGFLILNDNRLACSNNGFLVLNRLVLELVS